MDYQVLVATHLDKQHLHNHFLLNSVSYVNGKKFNDDMRCYYRMREASDVLCREYELSVVENPKGKTPRSIYFAEKNGEPTKFNLMREAIKAALKITSTPLDFKVALRDMGYELRNDPNRKYATLRRIGREKAVRLYRLGEHYDIPALEERLRENRYQYGSQMYTRYRRSQLQPFQPAKKYQLHGSLANTRNFGGLRGSYLHYCYLLGMLPKGSGRRPLSPEMREEWRHIEEISRQTRLICREKFETTDDVQSFIDCKDRKIQTLTAARSKCYNHLRRCDDPATIVKIKLERGGLSRQITTCRKEIKMARGIIDRSETIHAKCSIKIRYSRRESRPLPAGQRRLSSTRSITATAL